MCPYMYSFTSRNSKKKKKKRLKRRKETIQIFIPPNIFIFTELTLEELC